MRFRNIIASVILLSIISIMGYVFYYFAQNIHYAMEAKDFEREINRQLVSLLEEFDNRVYYGEMRVLAYDQFVCSQYLDCVSPFIKIGWSDTDTHIMLLDTHVTVRDLSEERLKISFETTFSFFVNNNGLSVQQRDDIALIQSLFPTAIGCDFETITKGANSMVSKNSSCDIYTPAADYNITVNADSMNARYGNVMLPTLLLGIENFLSPQVLSKMQVFLKSFQLQVHSKNIDDKVFDIVTRTKIGSLLNRQQYNAALTDAISHTLNAFSADINTFGNKEAFKQLAQGVSSLLLGTTKRLNIALEAISDTPPLFFDEEEIEEWSYQVGENPKHAIEVILKNYHITIDEL